MTSERILVDYRLPDGAIVKVDDSAAKGAPAIDFTLKGGAIVTATRCHPADAEYIDRHLTDTEAIDRIREVLHGNEWTPDHLDAIADIVRQAGRLVSDLDEHTTDRMIRVGECYRSRIWRDVKPGDNRRVADLPMLEVRITKITAGAIYYRPADGGPSAWIPNNRVAINKWLGERIER